MSINIDKFAFPNMLMLLFLKYVLPILIFFPTSKYFQPLKVVDPDHPLAALVRKAQSDNNSSTPQSADGAAVQASQAEYSSDCKCFVRRQLLVCSDDCVWMLVGREYVGFVSSCVFVLLQSPEFLNFYSEYLLSGSSGKPGKVWGGEQAGGQVSSQ